MQDYIDYGARISKKRDYCYKMWHKWDDTKPTCVFILMHPPQIFFEEEPAMLRKCGRIAGNFGCGSYIAVSLFAYICRVPCDIIGNNVENFYSENNKHITEVLENAKGSIIAVWGSCSSLDECVRIRLKDRAEQVKDIMRKSNKKIHCLGMKNGHPIAPTTSVKKLQQFKLD